MLADLWPMIRAYWFTDWRVVSLWAMQLQFFNLKGDWLRRKKSDMLLLTWCLPRNLFLYFESDIAPCNTAHGKLD